MAPSPTHGCSVGGAGLAFDLLFVPQARGRGKLDAMEFEIALAGLVVGTLVGLTGIGGGSLLTPTLIVLFKVNPLTAVGSDLFVNAVTKLFGSAQHARQGTINYKLAGYLAIGSIPAALAGIGLISLLELYDFDVDVLLRRLLAGTLILAGATMAFRPLLLREAPDTDLTVQANIRVRVRTTVLMGAVAGFLVGLTSIGSGALIVPVLTILYPLPIRRIVGTDIFHAVLLAGVASLAHWGAGNVDWTLTGNVLIGSVPGVLVGARLSMVAPDRVLRTALGLLVILSGVRLVTA